MMWSIPTFCATRTEIRLRDRSSPTRSVIGPRKSLLKFSGSQRASPAPWLSEIGASSTMLTGVMPDSSAAR